MPAIDNDVDDYDPPYQVSHSLDSQPHTLTLNRPYFYLLNSMFLPNGSKETITQKKKKKKKEVVVIKFFQWQRYTTHFAKGFSVIPLHNVGYFISWVY